MKTVLTSIITSIITVVIALFVVQYFCNDDKCDAAYDDDHEKECQEHVKKDHEYHDGQGMCIADFAGHREEFDAQLSMEEKATIEAISEKFEDAHCEKMCPEGKKKFMEEHKADFEALLAIADNHKEYFDGLQAKMHEKHAKADAVVTDKCPEAASCKEATEKCKGEAKEVEKKVEKECKEATEACEEECFNTFKIHFLLLDSECEHDQ